MNNNINPYDQFDAEKAQYLKDNSYFPLAQDTAQELMDKTPWCIDTEVIKLKEWTFFKRVQGEIIPYSSKYLKDKTPEELRKGFARMIGSRNPDLTMIEHLQVLELKDGDTLVIKTQRDVSAGEMDHINDIVADLFKGMDIKTLVLMNGMDIGVIRSENEGANKHELYSTT